MRVVVFGLVTPLDHPPETTQWVTAWAGGLYILYINRRADGCRVRWSSGGHETKNNNNCPDPRDNCNFIRVGETSDHEIRR